jgi:FimV-like protein
MRQIMTLLLLQSGIRPFAWGIISAVLLSLSCSPAAVQADQLALAADDSSHKAEIEQIVQAQDAAVDLPSHLVVVGDTLWSVAKALRPDNMPMAQAMDIVYQYNPEAFLDGDSTKLIEGSVVSFPVTAEVEETLQVTISKENSALIIPSIEDSTEENTETQQKFEDRPVLQIPVAEEIMPESVDTVVDSDPSAELLDLAKTHPIDQVPAVTTADPQTEADTQSELAGDSPAVPANTSMVESETTFKQQFQLMVSEFDGQKFVQLLAGVKHLPIDIWIFLGALLLAVVINRVRKLNSANQSAEEATKQADKPIESVLDRPFATCSDDEVFSDIAEPPVVDNSTQKNSDTEEEAITLPGVKELEAQLQQDAVQQPQTGAVLEVDFDDDSFEIDPLQIKLDMASLCIEMGDIESAQAILEEIIGEADKQGKAKAREILDSIET